MVRCTKCDAPIRWAKTASGRWMPLDEDPSPDGTVLLDGAVCSVYTPAAAAECVRHGQPMYTTHWATCPNAADFRRPKPNRETP